nr:gustatory receptor 4 [Pieris rapae]
MANHVAKTNDMRNVLPVPPEASRKYKPPFSSSIVFIKIDQCTGKRDKRNMKAQGKIYIKTPEREDDFLPTVTCMFAFAKTFGIPTYGGKLALIMSVTILVMLIILEIFSIWKLVRTLNGWNQNPNGSVIARLSGSIFYGNGLLSMLITWKLARKWPSLSKVWLELETKCSLHFPPNAKIRRRLLFVVGYTVFCAFVEHVLSMMSSTGLDCPLQEYFERYILSSHGFLITKHEYNLWLAIPIFILSKQATVLWNFQDLIIILISMGLTSRYNRLNVFLRRLVMYENDMKEHNLQQNLVKRVYLWRRLRIAYVHQSQLVKRVDKCLGGLILLSNLNNLYFICLQLFLGISQEKGTVINRIYYFYSLSWLMFRASGVLLAAADVHLHSQKALPALYRCSSAAYNIEIKRLKYQLQHQFISLSGMDLFYLSRQKLLEVAGAIVKYELILLQYDKDRN